MKTNRIIALALLGFSTLNVELSPAFAQGTAFTYQGRLNSNGTPANGSYDFQFILFNVNQFGFPVGVILTNANTAVNNGLFTTTLDFGAGVFMGSNYWLEISVRTNSNSAFMLLTPRQPVTPTPYAVFAEHVGSGGLASGTYGSAVTFNNPANNFAGSFSGNGGGLTNLNASQLASGTIPDTRLSTNIARVTQVWKIGGNAGTTSDFIGTTDNQPFDVRVNNARAVRYRLGTDVGGRYLDAPNVIGGYSGNSASATIVGATIGGGGGTNSFLLTEFANRVTHNFGTVSGGEDNTVSDDDATVGGGQSNTASGFGATVAGGGGNIAGGTLSAIHGGYQNVANGYAATIGAGYRNSAGGTGAVVGGGQDNTASGAYATVPGGVFNLASGVHSSAAGNSARATHDGSFVWADGQSFNFSSTVSNQFRVRATGGAAFVTAIDGTGAATAGVRVQSGDTSWSSISDRNAKKNFTPVSGEAVLEKLAALPVQFWNYKWESDTNTPHLGPMAQDFKAAFYPGRDDKSISTLEFDGVELAAIQGLNQKLEETRAELKRRDAENDALQSRLSALEEIVAKLNQKGNRR